MAELDKTEKKRFGFLLIDGFTFLHFLSNSPSIDSTVLFQRPIYMVIKQKLTPEQYYVTQEKGTEPPYKNPYWNNEKPGIYVDVVTGEPLFSSPDKYNAKTGWPSFSKPFYCD